MYKILKNTIEMDDYSVQKLSNLQPPEPFEWNTVEGTELNVSDCIGGKGKIEVKGNTEQKQLSGKNLLNIADGTYSKNGITAVVKNGKITLNGTATETSFLTIPFRYEYDGSTYSLSANNENTIGSATDSGNYASLRISGKTESQALLGNKNATKTFTLSQAYNDITIRTGAGLTYNNFVLYPQLEVGQPTSYETYCGGQPSPNPDYPQPIKVVTGDNVVKHAGKNEFYGEKFGLLWWNSSTGNFTNSGNFKSFICKVKTNTQYVISKKNVSNRFIILTSQNEPAAGKPYKRVLLTEVDSQRTSFSFTTQSDEKYIFFGLHSGTDEIEIAKAIEEIQLEEGTTPTPYEPYREESFEVNLGKNLFDKDNANIINAGLSSKVISTSEYNRVLYIPVKASTTYTIQRRNDGDVNRFRVGSCTVIPANNVSVPNAIENDNATNITITTGANDKYLAVMYYRTYETVLTEQQILDSIQIEEGSTATSYSKYFTPIELCKIGDYQDTVFKNEVGDENYNAELESGAWYEKKVIDKKILDDSWTWFMPTTNRFHVNIPLPDGEYDLVALCDKFINALYWPVHINTDKSFIVHNGNWGNNMCRISFLDSDYDSLDEWTQFVSEKNLIVYHRLLNPTYEKITDPTLISQLEALRKAKWFKGVNHWFTETENLEPNLKGTYRQAVESEVP